MNNFISDNETPHENEMLKYARYYHDELGWSLIPVSKEKRPLIQWMRYQETKATLEEIEGWIQRWPDMCLGAVTGEISGIVAIDIDEQDPDVSSYPVTAMSKTGRNGRHLFYEYPGKHIANAVRMLPNTDLRGDGGFVVIAPSVSIHGSYEWINTPLQYDFVPFPQNLLPQASAKTATNWQEFVQEKVPEGQRNDAATAYAGKLRHDLSPELWETAGWSGLKQWNQDNCSPPLSEKELRDVFNSVGRYPNEKKNGETAKDPQDLQLLSLVTKNTGITLFHDQYGTAYARLPIRDHLETWACKSSSFKKWLAKSAYEKSGRHVPGSTALANVLTVIESIAEFDGDRHNLGNRVAMQSGDVWYDLANDRWQAVRITPQGWSIENDPPILFRRFSHTEAQVTPVSGGNVRDVFNFVNISDREQQILFAVYLVSCFLPGFAHPMPYVYGPQGSAKSTLSKVVRKLVDPSKIEVISLTNNPEQLAQQLNHHHLVFYDNVSYIKGDVADLLSRAITGSGFSKRVNYSDDDDFIFNVQVNVGINGINLSVAHKPDLLERSILFELERMEDSGRKEEHELMAAFAEAQPRIFGAILDTVAKALALKPSISVPSLPRMADFALYGCAIAEALGYGQDEFLDAYRANIASQTEEVINNDSTAVLLVKFMRNQDEWTGSYTDLLNALKREELDSMRPDMTLPKNAAALSRKLGVLKTTLAAAGIHFTVNKGEQRSITIRRIQA